MSLTKDDLKEIKSLIDSSGDDVTRNLSDKIDNTKKQIINEMDIRFEAVEKNINREISDLVDINRAFMTRTDQIDHRLRIVERKLGLIVK